MEGPSDEVIMRYLINHYNSDNKNIEIIVVDNASTDNSVELLKRDFSSVKLVQNNKNVGFATGNNIGVSKAKGKYILLLNTTGL